MKFSAAALALAACASSSASVAGWDLPVPVPHAFQPLDFAPRVATPTNFTLVQTAPDNRSAIYEIDLAHSAAYSEPALLAVLEGTPYEVGQAYGSLLGKHTDFLYSTWVGTKFPNALELDAVAALLDWLWDYGLAKHTPQEFVDELKGIDDTAGDVKHLSRKVRRIVALSNLPADSQNIERVILDLIVNADDAAAARQGMLQACGETCAAAGSANIDVPTQVGAAARAAAELLSGSADRKHGPGMCDYFAVWGEHTQDGRLLSSRNLDFDRDINATTGKLVTVVRYSGDDAIPYATFGTPGYWGALAGISGAGVTVSQANLDNSDVSFRGIAWPLRLRQILSSAQNLADARDIWAQAANTGAFNFLVGSAIDVNATGGAGRTAAKSAAAMALETTFKHTSEFTGDDPVEDSATFSCSCELVNSTGPEGHPVCVNGTTQDGVKCNWPFSNDTVSIGASLPNAVWRSNHGLHPATMATQEPLWNDTVMRYFMLHDAIEELSAQPERITVRRFCMVRSVQGSAALGELKGLLTVFRVELTGVFECVARFFFAGTWGGQYHCVSRHQGVKLHILRSEIRPEPQPKQREYDVRNTCTAYFSA